MRMGLLVAVLVALGVARARPPVDLFLESALHPMPPGVPDAVVAMPDAAPKAAVVYLHGWESCARGVARVGLVDCGNGVLVDGMGLGGAVTRGALPAALLVPQLKLLHRGGDYGRWRDPAAPADWLDEVDRAVGLGRARERLVVVAHSGGYGAAAALLRADPTLDVRAVVLLDALYGEVDTFAAWVCGAPGRVLVTLHTDHAGTTARNNELARAVAACRGPSSVRRENGLPAGDLTRNPLLVVRTGVPHGAIPAARLAAILQGLRPALTGP